MEADELSREIIAKYEEVKETSNTVVSKNNIWMLLSSIVDRVFPTARLVQFGSSTTGLSIEGSDMDLMLLLNCDELSQVYKIKALETLYETLKYENEKLSEKFFSNFELLSDCVVPLLRFKTGLLTKKSGNYIEVELSVSKIGAIGRYCNALKSDVQNGTRNTHLLICYNEVFHGCDYPVLNILGVVIKHWAKHHSLLGNFYHRLSSYGLQLMLIFYLQQKNILPCLQENYPESFVMYLPVLNGTKYTFNGQIAAINEMREQMKFKLKSINLGTLLLGFFQYYGDFDFGKVISVRTGKLLEKWDCANFADKNISRDSAKEWFKEILIEDPIYQYNVARATSNPTVSRYIITTFKNSVDVLKRRKTLNDIFNILS